MPAALATKYPAVAVTQGVFPVELYVLTPHVTATALAHATALCAAESQPLPAAPQTQSCLLVAEGWLEPEMSFSYFSSNTFHVFSAFHARCTSVLVA